MGLCGPRGAHTCRWCFRARKVEAVLERLPAPYRLFGALLYGCGLRLSECLELRIHCFNLDSGLLTVHDGKGQKDRTVPLPARMMPEIREQIEAVRRVHKEDLAVGYAPRPHCGQAPNDLTDRVRTAGKLSLTTIRTGDGPAVKPRRIGRFEGFRNFVPKHAFTRYCWLTIDSLVKRGHGPPAGALRAFALPVGPFATPWLHPKGG